MPASLHTGFHGSPLVELLSRLGVDQAAPAQRSFAERCSPWLAWTDAIALATVLSPSAPDPRAHPRPHRPAHTSALAERCRLVRAELAAAITADTALAACDADTAPDRGAYLAHQRQMDARLAPLRADLRAALATLSPAAAQLAALDAVLDQALAAHERQLLAAVPGWLARQARHSAAPGADTAPDRPWQAALLAELDLRFQPIEGLLEALRGTAPHTP